VDDIVIRAVVLRFPEPDPGNPDPSHQKWVVSPLQSAFVADLTEGLEDLASNLRESGRSVAVIEPVPYNTLPTGYHIPVEDVLIFIGSGVGGALINATVTDIYKSAKTWARARFKKKREQDRMWQVKNRFTIYGPDGKDLLRWEWDSKIERWHLPQSVESESVQDSSDSSEASDT
jgi:hypothetical protein